METGVVLSLKSTMDMFGGMRGIVSCSGLISIQYYLVFIQSVYLLIGRRMLGEGEMEKFLGR